MEQYLIPFLILGLFVFIIFWVWALLDLASSTFKKTNWKIAWLLIIVLFPVLGSILYLLLRKDFKAQKRRSFSPGFNTNNHIE